MLVEFRLGPSKYQFWMEGLTGFGELNQVVLADVYDRSGRLLFTATADNQGRTRKWKATVSGRDIDDHLVPATASVLAFGLAGAFKSDEKLVETTVIGVLHANLSQLAGEVADRLRHADARAAP